MLVHDLMRPTVVITGLWNPAIFQVPWVAPKVFEKPEGGQLVVVEVQMEGRAPVVYIGDHGYSVTPSRLEMYVNVFDDESISQLEGLSVRIVDLLRHTPMTGVGLNFAFQIADPGPDFFDKLKTREKLELSYRIEEQTYVTRIDLGSVKLNLRREVEDGRALLDFNFHNAVSDPEQIRAVIAGGVKKAYLQAIELTTKIYGESSVQARGHEFPEPERLKVT